MKINIEDEQISFQVLRMLSEVSSGQADVNEVLNTARVIREGDYNSWYREWASTADRMRHTAEEFLVGHHFTSAAETFLRASNYYRAAAFYRGVLMTENCSAETSDKLEQMDALALDCFQKVIQYGTTVILPMEIPYEKTSLPALFYPVSKGEDTKTAPTLILLNGYDGTKEEMYGIALKALKRGMNCLSFEGPGQGEMIRRREIPFRPDWENVLSPVVDFLIGKLGVNSQKIILWGQSMGGYLAPRAAAFEHRLSACVANSGVYDFVGERRPEGMEREEFFQNIATTPEIKVDTIMKKQMAQSAQVNWALRHGMYVFGVKNLKEFMLKAKHYYLGDVVQQIECPTLIVDSENETNFPGQAKRLYDQLHCPKKYLLFTREQDAAEHCEVGAKLFANSSIFNWIEETLQSI